MKNLGIVFSISTILFLTSCNPVNNKKPVPKAIHYALHVEIVTGSHKGEIYEGEFTYDISAVNWMKNYDTVQVKSLDFNYRGMHFTESNLDYHPYLIFRKGALMEVRLVGGPLTDRFGLNDGFIRWQFTRPAEAWIPAGGQYFGYLDQLTFVDGAGKVKSIPLK